MGMKLRKKMSPKDGTSETNFGMIEADPRGKENGPKSAETDSGPNPNTYMEVGLLPRIVHAPDDSAADELRKYAEKFLELTFDQGQRYSRNRRYYAGVARRYGMTNQQIGDILGITEARVRQILAGA